MAKVLGYSYVPFPLQDILTGKILEEFFRPMIPIKLSHGSKITSPLDALIDSGSDRNLFPAFWGELLGLDFKKMPVVYMAGIGKSEVIAYRGKIDIWVGDKKLETEADFCCEQPVPILGRKGFFNFFKSITFKDSERFVYLEF